MPFWSRDGQWVNFLRRNPGITYLMRAPVGGGAPVVMGEAPGVMVMPALDGSHIILERDESLWLRSWNESGPGELIVRPVSHGNWTTIRDGVCYLQQSAGGAGVECLDLRSKRLRLLVSFPDWPRVYGPPAFAVSPDRKWVIYGRTDQLESNIMRATLPPSR